MKKILLFVSSMMVAMTAGAETAQSVQDDLLKESSEVLKCAPIVAPVVQVKPEMAPAVAVAEVVPNNDELTPTEKLKAYRTKLEEKNMLLLQKKMEMIRLEQEMALLRNLERSMDQTLNAINKL